VSLDIVAARAAHTATTLPDGRVFVAGGCVVDGCGTATAETFLVAADGSAAVRGADMAGPRDGHTATLIGDTVVLVGGFSGEGEGALDSVAVYRASTGELRALDPLAVARGGHAAAPLPDGRVMIVGGWVASHTYTSAAEIVDPKGGPPVRVPDLPYAADALDSVALADGRILVTGGQVRPAEATNQAAIFDSVSGTWTSVGPMNTPRLKHFSVLLEDGRVLVMGGTPDDKNLLATTELFDPGTGTFTDGPSLAEARYKMPGGAVVLDGHRVLIAGGGRSVEILDLASGVSTIVESFAGRGSFTTVNVLGSAGVLVLGGYDDRITLRRQYLVLGPQDLEGSGG
jgi:hypothetical protein